jgi:hypothetical protein
VTALCQERWEAISGKPTWFEKFDIAGSQAEADRKLFSH